MTTTSKIEMAMQVAELNAWKSLAGYKLLMFGYHAARWMGFNQLLDDKRPNPFTAIVGVARQVLADRAAEAKICTRCQEIFNTNDKTCPICEGDLREYAEYVDSSRAQL